MNRPTRRALLLGSILLLSLPLLVMLATAYSETGFYSPISAMRVMLAELGFITPVPEHDILKLRLLRALTALGVGGSLALAGAMTQGLFRNPLAEPGLLGVNSGAALGAVLGIAVLGGYGPQWAVWARGSTPGADDIVTNSPQTYLTLALVPIMALAGALITGLTIYRIAARQGRLSVATLLLTGLAFNSMIAALMAGLQVLLLQDWQVSRAILAWGFGALDDRTSFHVAVVATGAVLALASIPFVGLQLDLLAGGEEDAAALGADPGKIKTLVLACAAIATAAAVSVSGQIAFLGLLVPHLMRMIVGPHHRLLLPISFLAGAVLLVGVLVFQHALCPMLAVACNDAGFVTLAAAATRVTSMQPGVITSLLGSPVFLLMLLRYSRQLN